MFITLIDANNRRKKKLNNNNNNESHESIAILCKQVEIYWLTRIVPVVRVFVDSPVYFAKKKKINK